MSIPLNIYYFKNRLRELIKVFRLEGLETISKKVVLLASYPQRLTNTFKF